MKKTRILAALLCVMMVVCSLPMMASAKLAAADYNAMGSTLGATSTVPNAGSPWPAMQFDFKDNFSPTTAGVTTPEGVTYDNTNGMTFPASAVIWKYYPTTSTQWSPLVEGGYVVRMKLNTGGSLELQACQLYSNNRSFVIVSETGITAFETSGSSFAGSATINAFVPGNDWVDIVVAQAGDGYSVYARKVTDSAFTLVTTAASYRSNGKWSNDTGIGTGLTLSGKAAYVSDAVMLDTSDVLMEDEEDDTTAPVLAPEVPYTAVGAVFGRTASIAHPGTADWGAMNLDFTAEGVGSTEGLVVGDGITFDTTTGATVPAGTGVYLNYSSPVKYQSKWSPMFLGSMGFSFKMKNSGTINVSACTGWDTNRVFMDITKDGISFAASTHTIDNEFVPGTDWNDLLVVMGSEVGATDVSYYVYAKKATDDEFTKIATVTTARNNGSGLLGAGQDAVFYGQGFNMGYLKSFQASGNLLPGNVDNTPNPGITEGLTIAIGKTLGGTYAKPATASADWAAMNLDFSGSFDSTQDGVNTGSGITYDATNGVIFPATDAVFRYRPTCKHNGWSPLCISGNYSFSFKLNADGQLIQESPQVWVNNRTYLDITPKKVVIYDGGEEGGSQRVVTNLVDYEPGIAWNDVLVTTNSGGGYTVYMKKATDSDFTKVAETINYRVGGGAWGSTGFCATARSAMIGHAVSWVSVLEGERFDSIEEIAGGSVATTYNFTLNESFNTTLSLAEGSNTVGITHNGEYTADGWKGVNWQFVPTSAWSPLTSGGEDTMIYFKAKTETKFNIQGRSATSGRLYFDISASARPFSNAPTKTNHSDSVPGTDWAEYLITRYNDGAGYALYMKSETGTAGKWEQMLTTSDYNTNNATGIALYSEKADAYFKDVKILSTTKAVADAATKPADATTLYFEDDFTDAPDYNNLSCVGATYDGDLVLTKTSGVAAEAVLGNAEIPKGGYAEYRIKVGATSPTMHFYDGEKAFSIYTRVNYGAIYSADTALLYGTDAGDSYRTWRVVRHEDGNYSAYCKVDGDTNWYAVQVNAVGKAAANTPQVKLVGTAAYDGGDGVTEVDYLKIYGPAPEGELVFTDGYGTKLVEDSVAALTYNAPRAFVKKGDVAKTLILAEYNNDDILVNAEYAEIEAGTGTVSVPYVFTNKENYVRVFYWDGATQANLNIDSTFVVE